MRVGFALAALGLAIAAPAGAAVTYIDFNGPIGPATSYTIGNFSVSGLTGVVDGPWPGIENWAAADGEVTIERIDGGTFLWWNIIDWSRPIDNVSGTYAFGVDFYLDDGSVKSRSDTRLITDPDESYGIPSFSDGEIAGTDVLTKIVIRPFTRDGSPSTLLFDYIPVEEVSAGVPEPNAWTLMILGFGLVGTGLRRNLNRTLRGHRIAGIA